MTEWQAVGDGGAVVRSRWIYNCYVVPDGGAGRPLVVDVGLPSHARAVSGWLTQERGPSWARDGIGPTITATHLHADHVAGLPALASGGAGGAVLLPERGRAYVGGEVPRTPGPRAVAKILPVMRSQPFSIGALAEAARGPRVGYGVGAFALPVDEPTWVADGDRLEGAPDWVAIVAPGHTDDSTVYYHEASRTLASGDAVLTVGGRAWFNPEYVDGPASAATEDRFRSLRVDVLLPGHGRPLVGTDLLASALGHDDRAPRRRR